MMLSQNSGKLIFKKFKIQDTIIITSRKNKSIKKDKTQKKN